MQSRIILVVGAFVLGGCASSPANPQSTSPESKAAPVSPQHRMQGDMNDDMAGMCPMAVHGTTARAEDVEGTAALVFTTTGDVDELRRRVIHMSEMHNRHHGEGGDMMGMRADGGSSGDDQHAHRGGMHDGMMGNGMMGNGMMGNGMMGNGMMGNGMMPPSTTRSEQVEAGERLIFTPQNPADLTKLREHIHQHAAQMASGKCPMMSMHSQQPAGDHESHHPEGN